MIIELEEIETGIRCRCYMDDDIVIHTGDKVMFHNGHNYLYSGYVNPLVGRKKVIYYKIVSINVQI